LTVYSQTKYPSNTSTSAYGDGVTWVNPSNVCASDNTYARTSAELSNNESQYSDYLYSYDYGFSIPDTATILGYIVYVEAYAADTTSTKGIKAKCYITANGQVAGSAKNSAEYTEDSEETFSIGGSADLWGQSLSASDINLSSFGALLQNYHNIMVSGEYLTRAYVDSIKIQVYYDVPSPTPPSDLSTTNFDATNSQPLTWSWQPTFTGDAITACRVQIIDVSTGSTTYDSGKKATTIPLLTLPANTLTNGKQYQWKVLVYDSLDRASSYSSLATFYTSAAPTATITYPANNGDTIATSSLTVTWTYSDPESGAQSAYQAMLLDSDQKILENTGKVSTAGLSKTFSYALANNTNYRVAVYVWDNKGVASLMSVRTFTVSYTPPAKPTLAISADTTRGSAGLTITNPTPGAGQPAVSYNDIYRKKSTETDYIRIATSVAEDGAWTDYTLASGVEYDYIIRAIGTDGSYADSDAVDITLTLTAPQIALASNYSTYLDIAYLVGVSESRNYNKSMVVFAGREAPVAEFSEHVNMEMTLSIIMDDYADVETLIGYMETKETLLYRDYRGRREFVTVGSIEVQDNGSHFTVGLTLERTSYSEVV
jgi:hypothetical protein